MSCCLLRLWVPLQDLLRCLKSLNHERFVAMCVLGGCDYTNNVHINVRFSFLLCNRAAFDTNPSGPDVTCCLGLFECTFLSCLLMRTVVFEKLGLVTSGHGNSDGMPTHHAAAIA